MTEKKLMAIARLALAEIERRLQAVSTRDLAIIAGICVDKAQLLAGKRSRGKK